jgi:hypothetical protein
MALSAATQQTIVMYLGWSGKSIIEGSTNYNSQVADRLKNLTPELEANVIGLTEKITAIDQKLEGAACRLAAKRVDEIELNPDEIYWLRKERSRLIRLLSQLLDIPMMNGNGVNVSVCV